MRLPDALRDAISDEIANVDGRELAVAAARLTERYKRGEFSAALTTAADRAAYLAVRMPATFAACSRVFTAIRERLQDTQLSSLLDLGSGPGTAMWAAAEHLAIASVTCIERNHALVELGQRLASHSDDATLNSARWVPGDLSQIRDLPAHDVVIFSYVVGEVPDASFVNVLRAAWLKSASMLVVIEPGTPEGFRRVHSARTLLIDDGAHIVAPCPHHDVCPMFATGDWCHFGARVERTAEHRRLKAGTLGYEDEKFSYVVAAKRPVALPDSRVLRHPLIHPGHMRLTLCRPNRPGPKTVTKSQKVLWRYARHIEWGDAWQPPSKPPDTEDDI
jgi:ribosomal protein RSM22 (predicted rRNA methylase)